MIINLRKENRKYDVINSGDILILQSKEEDKENPIPFLYIYDELRSKEDAFLICLVEEFCIYNANEHLNVENFNDNKDLIAYWLSKLNYNLVRVIPSNQVELKNI